jgi:hypothetical protein
MLCSYYVQRLCKKCITKLTPSLALFFLPHLFNRIIGGRYLVSSLCSVEVQVLHKNVGFEVLTAVVMKSTIFLDIKPCRLLKVTRRFGLPPAFTLVSCSACSTLKMEATCYSKMSVYFKRTTRRYIPEDSSLDFIKMF